MTILVLGDIRGEICQKLPKRKKPKKSSQQSKPKWKQKELLKIQKRRRPETYQRRYFAKYVTIKK